MSIIRKIWVALDGNKTALGGTLISAAIALGILTNEDAIALQATLPAIMAGFGALVQLVGLAHKAIKALSL